MCILKKLNINKKKLLNFNIFVLIVILNINSLNVFIKDLKGIFPFVKINLSRKKKNKI